MLSLSMLAALPTPSPTTSSSATTADDHGLLYLVVLGALVLAGFVVVYLISTLRADASGLAALPTFSRVYSLLAVVFTAAVLAFADVNDSSRSAAYAVLGAVAGYLAGQKNTTTETTEEPAPGNPAVAAPPAAGAVAGPGPVHPSVPPLAATSRRTIVRDGL